MCGKDLGAISTSDYTLFESWLHLDYAGAEIVMCVERTLEAISTSVYTLFRPWLHLDNSGAEIFTCVERYFGSYFHFRLHSLYVVQTMASS